MPYGFNEDKSRYDLQDDLDRISALEAAAGFDPSVFDERFEAIEDNIDDDELALGIGSAKTKNTFYAAPNGSDGEPTFRKIVKADLPDLATTDISGLGSIVTNDSTMDATISIGSTNSKGDWNGAYYGEITLPVGTWIIVAAAQFSSNNAGFRQVCITTSPAGSSGVIPTSKEVRRYSSLVPASPTGYSYTQAIRIAQCNSETTFRCAIRQNSGSAINVGTYMRAIRIR